MILNVIVPFYNIDFTMLNRCLKTIMLQSFKTIKICFVDDHSDNMKTFNSLLTFWKQHQPQFVTIKTIYNREHSGTIVSIKNAIMVLEPNDDDPIVIVDGDDALHSNDVFHFLNKVYLNQDVYASFGNFVEMNCYNDIVSKKYNIKNGKLSSLIRSRTFDFQKVITNNTFRDKNLFMYSHIKTFRYYLFKQIKDQDLQKNGTYFQSATDVAIMIPICELAGKHLYFLEKVLYNYYIDNENSHHNNVEKKNIQKVNRDYIFQLPKYSPIEIPLEVFNNKYSSEESHQIKKKSLFLTTDSVTSKNTSEFVEQHVI